MTPKQKRQHITNIRAIFAENDLTKDRWGNYPHRAVRTRPIGQLDQFSSSR